jgi:hypothetical protein
MKLTRPKENAALELIGAAVIVVAAAVSLSGCLLPFVVALTATEIKYESSDSYSASLCGGQCVPSGPALPFSMGPQQTAAIYRLRVADAQARCNASGAGANPDCLAYLLQ